MGWYHISFGKSINFQVGNQWFYEINRSINSNLNTVQRTNHCTLFYITTLTHEDAVNVIYHSRFGSHTCSSSHQAMYHEKVWFLIREICASLFDSNVCCQWDFLVTMVVFSYIIEGKLPVWQEVHFCNKD